MQNILDGMLKKERDVVELRRVVRNWSDWALRGRLEDIKEALNQRLKAKAMSGDVETSASQAELLKGLPSPDATVTEPRDTLKPSKKRGIDMNP